MSSSSSPHVSLPAVLGGAVAAATAAALSTRLGLVGTVVGAAVASAVSTVVAGSITGWIERLRGAVHDREPGPWRQVLVGGLAVTAVAFAFHTGWSLLTSDLPPGSFAARMAAQLSGSR